MATSCINPVLYGYLNESFRKEYKNLLKKLPWYPAEQTVSRNESRNRNGIELPPIRRHSRSLNEHSNHPPASKSLQNIDKLGIKSRSCVTINIESRNYNLTREIIPQNNNEKTKYTNHLLVPSNNFMANFQQDFKGASPGYSSSRSSSFPNEDSSFQIFNKEDGYNSVIINIPNVPSLQNHSNIKSTASQTCLPNCSNIREEMISVNSANQAHLFSNLHDNNIMVNHHDINTSCENEHNDTIEDCAKMSLQKEFNSSIADNEPYSISSCSNSNCSASWCSLCSFSSKNDTGCCSLCNCSLVIAKNESSLIRSLSLPIKCQVMNKIQTHLPAFIERTSSCKVTKGEISDTDRYGFHAMN